MTQFFPSPAGGQAVEGVFVLDPATGQPAPTPAPLTDTQLRAAPLSVSMAATPGLTDAQLRAAPVPVVASSRVCLGTERVTVTSAYATLKSLMTGGTFPVGTVVVELQADGGTIRIRRDNGVPTVTLGYRLDDGMVLTVDSSPDHVRVIAAVSTPLNVACFDRV